MKCKLIDFFCEMFFSIFFFCVVFSYKNKTRRLFCFAIVFCIFVYQFYEVNEKILDPTRVKQQKKIQFLKKCSRFFFFVS